MEEFRKPRGQYALALRVLRERNPRLRGFVDTIVGQLFEKHALYEPREPDARIYGVHRETKYTYMLMWRSIFQRENNLMVEVALPKDDPEYTGGQLDPQLSMDIRFDTEQWRLYARRHPINTPWALIYRESPLSCRQAELQHQLVSLLEELEIQHIQYTTVQSKRVALLTGS